MIKVGPPRVYIKCPNCGRMIFDGKTPYLCGYCGAKFYYNQEREIVFLEKPVRVFNCNVRIPNEDVLHDKDAAVEYAVRCIAKELANKIIQNADLRTFDDFENYESFCKNVYEIHGEIRIVNADYRFKRGETE